MKKVIAIFICLTLLISASVGCQQTPSEEAVVNLSDDKLQETIEATPAPEAAATAPSHFQETLKLNNKLTVDIDCDMETGSGSTHPVYAVSRITIDRDLLLKTMQGVYPEMDQLRLEAASREELTEDLMRVEKGTFADWDEQGNPIWEPYEGQEEEIAALQEQIEALPAECSYVPLDADAIGEISDYGYFVIHDPSGNNAYVTTHNQENRNSIYMTRERNGNIQPENWVLQGEAIPGEAPSALENVQLTQEEAEATADGVLTALGLAHMGLAGAEKARCIVGWDVKSEGWQLTYAVAVEGTIPVATGLLSGNTLFKEEDEAYSAPWRAESITMYITESGVEAFTWSNISSIGEELNANVSLLPLEEIQEQIRKQMKYGLSWVEDPTGYGLGSIRVTRIVLTTAIVQTEADSACLVPAWAVFYIGSEEEEAQMDESLLLINAIDGSQIRSYS